MWYEGEQVYGSPTDAKVTRIDGSVVGNRSLDGHFINNEDTRLNPNNWGKESHRDPSMLNSREYDNLRGDLDIGGAVEGIEGLAKDIYYSIKTVVGCFRETIEFFKEIRKSSQQEEFDKFLRHYDSCRIIAEENKLTGFLDMNGSKIKFYLFNGNVVGPNGETTELSIRNGEAYKGSKYLGTFKNGLLIKGENIVGMQVNPKEIRVSKGNIPSVHADRRIDL